MAVVLVGAKSTVERFDHFIYVPFLDDVRW